MFLFSLLVSKEIDCTTGHTIMYIYIYIHICFQETSAKERVLVVLLNCVAPGGLRVERRGSQESPAEPPGSAADFWELHRRLRREGGGLVPGRCVGDCDASVRVSECPCVWAFACACIGLGVFGWWLVVYLLGSGQKKDQVETELSFIASQF